jgi:hypothetical protein
MTSSMASSSNRQQIVQITSVDPTTNTAVGQTRQGQSLTINTQYLVGAVHYTPGVNEQWYVKQVGTVTWALDRKLPKNTNDLLNVADNPVPGQVQIGSSGIVSGPLNLQGSVVNAMAPLGLVSASAGALPDPVAAGAGALIWNSTTSQVMFSDGTGWYSVGGSGGGGPVTWSDIEDVPSTFPSDWSDISDIPADFPTTWSDITDIPSTFPSDWSTITDKPSTFPPTLPTGVPDGTKFWRDDDTWAHVDGGGAGTLVIGAIPTGTINGSNTVFTTTQSFDADTTMVYLNGLRLSRGIDYSETTDTTITLTLAPGSGDVVTMDYLLPSVSSDLVVGEVPAGTLNGSNDTFTVSTPFVASTTSVFRNGLREQLGVGYNESGGNAVVFTTPPLISDLLAVDYLANA